MLVNSVFANSWIVPSVSIQAVIPEIISVAVAATICAPKISPYFGSHKILTKPSVSPSAIALPFADNGNLNAL